MADVTHFSVKEDDGGVVLSITVGDGASRMTHLFRLGAHRAAALARVLRSLTEDRTST